MKKLKKQAAEYIAAHNLPSGWVVFYNGVAAGWMREVGGQHGSASAWVPGCIAVKSGAPVFVATGGSHTHGALYWRQEP